tara:strand:+ start:4489 stop:5412 length:924 start_codon:yes stop_codon:yes gene_type:complete
MGGVQSENLWERLRLDLKVINDADFMSIAPAMAALHGLIEPHSEYQRHLKSLNFLFFEFQSRWEAQPEKSHELPLLNEFFFSDKMFQPTPSSDLFAPKQFLLGHCVDEKQGHPLLIQFLYLFLGQQIHLKLSPAHTADGLVIQWTFNDKTHFLHLGLSGRSLEKKELAVIFNSEYIKEKKSNQPAFEPLTPTQFFKNYLTSFLNHYLKHESDNQEMTREKIILWSAYLELEPNHLPYLRERGMTYFKRGDEEHARFDLIRYFNFTSIDEASVELKRAYYQLGGKSPEENPFNKKTPTTHLTTNNLLH